MWCPFALASTAINLLLHINVFQSHHIELEVVRLFPGLKCMNSVVEAIQTESVRSCILHGMSVLNCHAVNYNIIDHTCQEIASNEVVIQTQRNTNSTLASFYNNHALLKTDVETSCAKSSVHWREQFTWAYNYNILSNSLVYADDAVRDKHVCKVSVGDNDLPGVSSTARKRCYFVHKGYIGYAEIYSVLILGADAMLQIKWIDYNVGESFPPGAFIGGQNADDTLLYICRASWKGVYSIGYYDSSNARASIPSVGHPAQVDLLVFTPNGPTSAGPMVEIAFPHFHVIQAHGEVDWVEHRGPEPMPTGVVFSNSYTAVAQSSGAFSTVAKFIDTENRFCLVYGIVIGYQTCGQVMLTHMSYQWELFHAGSGMPYNAIVGAYTPEINLFII